jgi:hypothetical protein
MREFEISLFQTQRLPIKGRLVLRTFEKFTFCEAFVVEFYIKLNLILRITTYNNIASIYMFGKLIIL